MTRILFLIAFLIFSGCSQAQEKAAGMTVEEYEPTSSLVVDENPLSSSRFPFIDVHSHWFRAPTMSEGAIDTLIQEMDGMNMGVIVNLSGGWGEHLAGALSNMESRHPTRIVTFANVDFDGIGEDDWTDRTVATLREDVRAGARGLKIYKNLGMTLRDTDGNRVAVNDPRIDPIWALCGELGIPVLIHSADPANFWQPKDKFNEKWLELKLRPNRYRAPGEFPSFESILDEHYNIMAKHPQTTFISAHLGWRGNDLDELGRLFDQLPNLNAGMGAVIYELGRQPRKAKAFMTQYKDRLLFGKDSYNVEEFYTYFRTFETADEYFPYYRKYHAQWRLYGIDLPDDVLKHIYYKNAIRIIPGIDASLFPMD